MQQKIWSVENIFQSLLRATSDDPSDLHLTYLWNNKALLSELEK